MSAALPSVRGRLATIGSIITVEFTLVVTSVALRGQAFDLLASGSTATSLLTTVVGFASTLLISSQLTNIRAYLRSKWAISDMRCFWEDHFPPQVRNTDGAAADHYFQLVTNYLPRVMFFRIECPQEVMHAALAYLAFTGYCLYYGMWPVLLAIPLTIASSSLTRHLWGGRYRDATHRIARDKEATGSWIKTYIDGNRELVLNAHLAEEPQRWRRWVGIPRAQLQAGMTQHLGTVVRRNFAMSFLEEAPMTIGVGCTILFGAASGLSVGAVYILATMVGYVTTANARLQNRQTLLHEWAATAQLIDAGDRYREGCVRADEHAASPQRGSVEPLTVPVAMLDGTVVRIGDHPGVHQLQGPNGSGKSTLLDAVAGFTETYADNPPVQALRQRVAGQVGMITASPAVFDFMRGSYAALLVGADERASDEAVFALLARQLEALVGPDLSPIWVERSNVLRRKWESYGQLSAGESVVLSFLRLALWWRPDLSIVIVDECDSYLSATWRAQFLDALRRLGEQTAVLFVSHREDQFDPIIGRGPASPSAEVAHVVP